MLTNKWTQEEAVLIREHYETISIKELQKLMPRRTRQQIVTKANYMGLRRTANLDENWSTREDAILRLNYRAVKKDEWKTLLPGMSKNRRTRRAWELGLTDTKPIKRVSIKLDNNARVFLSSLVRLSDRAKEMGRGLDVGIAMKEWARLRESGEV